MSHNQTMLRDIKKSFDWGCTLGCKNILNFIWFHLKFQTVITLSIHPSIHPPNFFTLRRPWVLCLFRKPKFILIESRNKILHSRMSIIPKDLYFVKWQLGAYCLLEVYGNKCFNECSQNLCSVHKVNSFLWNTSDSVKVHQLQAFL